MNVYVFGNGNLSFSDYLKYYQTPILKLLRRYQPHFILCDFRGVDTLTMELLKCETPSVTILHVGKKPRYLPDQYQTQVHQWNIVGDFLSDMERDAFAIHMCTHFLAIDFNTDEKRKSGTLKNIEACLEQNKFDINNIQL